MKLVSKIFSTVYRENRKNLLENEAKTVCKAYNIPITRFKVALSISDAFRIAHEISYPVVLKIVSPDILHKSDIGGVALNLKNPEEVERGYRKILKNVEEKKPDARIAGILVQEMAPKSTEVIVGTIKDKQFGQTIMFGLGGIFVEVLEDVSFRIAPVTKREAKLMIKEIKAYQLLRGYRNQPPLDTDIIAEIITNTSRLVTDHQEVEELDLNPIIVYEKGAKTVDARIILEQ